MIKELDILLGDYDVVGVDKENICKLVLRGIHGAYRYDPPSETQISVVSKVYMVLSKNADLPHKKWGIKDCETTMFKLLLTCNDIVAIVLVHDDGRKERYYVDYREGTSAGCNELQSAWLDDNENLVIKIGDFSDE